MIRNSPFEKEGEGLVALVATPIGNRKDITLRAIDFLKEADIVAAEDTRNTAQLLSFYGITNKRMVPLYSQIEAKNAERLVQEVKDKKLKLAFCSDAGMPGISDPGALLVQACEKLSVPVTLLPGPTASLSALVLSGFDTADFSFYGFLPTKAEAEKSFLLSLAGRPETLIFYESPKRVKKTLERMAEVFGPDREVSLVRELTKIHEEVLRGKISELLSSLGEEVKGECILVVSGAKKEFLAVTDEELKKRIKAARKEGKSASEAAKEIAKETGRKKSEIYDLALTIR